MPKQTRLGLFVSTTQNNYESTLYRGVVDAARAEGVYVTCFTSGALRAYRGFEFQRNVLFDLVDRENIDGLIVSGTLAHPIDAEEMQEFFLRYEKIPKVSIALSIPGTPYVIVESKQAIRDIVTHLAKAHGCRRMAFLRGPRGQQEAEERFEAFQETLAGHGLEFDPQLVLDGDYTIASGEAALREFLAHSPIRFDAIVSSNDSMALGAMQVLQEQGIRIPEQVALTGFDDVEARFAPVPLTSVRQDIYDQGSIAVRTLLDQIAGRAVALKNISFAPVVLRRSCGCAGFTPPETVEAAQASPDWAGNLLTRQPEIVAAVRASLSHIPAARVESWTMAWLEAIRIDLGAGAGREFQLALENAQREGFDLSVELAAWHRCLSTFMRQVMACLPEGREKKELAKIEDQARTQLGINMEFLENARQTKIELRDLALRETSESLMTTFGLAGIFDVLSEDLPRLNVNACYICLFEDPQNPADLSRLIYGMRDGQRLKIDPKHAVFPSRQLLPPGLTGALESSRVIVEALYSKEDRLGFMLLEVAPEDVSVTNALRALVSGALQSVLLLEQRRRAEAQLLEYQGQLEALVEKLEFSNQELESFAYSVSHDLRAPLRSIIGFSGILDNEYRPELPEDARHLLDRITQNARRMGLLIDNLLAFSRVSRQALRVSQVDMNRMVEETVAELNADLGEQQVEWTLGDLAAIPADPGLIRQVWVNLLGNAVKYSAKNPLAKIEVGSERTASEIVYHVRDNGAGFDMQYADKLFGVFQRLHREEDFPGTGIGLAIVKRIILRHDGRIWVQSAVGQGTTFYFSLPLLIRKTGQLWPGRANPEM
jgi:DNA-binding LacI/PurR family transcriptional regulator/signal transduction histidine kinase